jgi:hypothetical protein
MDSWLTTPTKGSGTISYTGFASQIVETTTKLAGTGSLDMNDDGYGMMFVPISGNFDIDNFRIGWWMHLLQDSAETNTLLQSTLSGSATVASDLRLYCLSDGTLRVQFRGATIFTTVATITNGNDYYIEIAGYGNSIELFLNGTSAGSGTNETPTAVTLDALRFFSADTMLDSYWDQMIFTNDYTKDIYAIRTVTDFN